MKAKLWQDYQIRPLIEPRELWREEKAMPDYDPTLPVTRALYPERVDTIVYTEKGQVQCRCPKSGEVRDLAFWGFESDRNTLKYRCPAAAFDLACAGREACERSAGGHVGEYGRTVRIDLDAHDRRIFTPTPYGSPSWKRGYHRRSALERINNRLDHAFEFEHHFIRGLARMRTRVGAALAVMMALALGHLLRSLLVTACMLAESLKDPLNWKLQPLRHLRDRSNCYRLERQLPGGALTH